MSFQKRIPYVSPEARRKPKQVTFSIHSLNRQMGPCMFLGCGKKDVHKFDLGIMEGRLCREHLRQFALECEAVLDSEGS